MPNIVAIYARAPPIRPLPPSKQSRLMRNPPNMLAEGSGLSEDCSKIVCYSSIASKITSADRLIGRPNVDLATFAASLASASWCF